MYKCYMRYWIISVSRGSQKRLFTNMGMGEENFILRDVIIAQFQK